MGVALFWFHLFCLLLSSAAWALNLLALPGVRRPWTVPALLLRGFLLLWLLNYTAFYFYFVFFPATPQSVYLAMTVVSLAASSGLIVALVLLIVALFRAVTRRELLAAGLLGVAVLAGGGAALLAGTGRAVFGFQNGYYALLTLTAWYGAAAVHAGRPLPPFRRLLWPPAGRRSIPRFQRRSLYLLAIFFPLIWIDHLYLNLPIGSAEADGAASVSGTAGGALPLEGATVTEGILVTGILLLILACRDIGRIRRLYRELILAGGRGIPQGFALEYNLTKREVEVGNLLAEGLSSREIAERLSISPKTVEAHLYNLYRKCRVSRRTSFLGLLRDSSY
jgi:DNA-binding CsgD family transcriptional regulator